MGALEGLFSVGPIASAASERIRSARLSLLLFVLFATAYGLFAQDSASHNTLCRAALTANLVQRGRVDIDGYESFTADLARREGRAYCDKAPGMSLLAAPAAFAFTRILPVTPDTPFDRTWTAFLYLCALSTSALLTASAGVAVFRYVRDRTRDVRAGLVAGVAFGLGSPVWGWATSFFSHAATAALLALGFIALDTALRDAEGGRRALAFALLGGLALGAATGVEYTSIAPAMIMGLGFAVAGGWRRPLAFARLFAVAGAAALAALIPVMAYHAAAFGSPLATGYAFAAIYEATADAGFLGLGAPRMDVIAQLLFSAERGVLWFAPIVIAMGWATARLFERSDTRTIAAVTILTAAWFLLMNAGYAYWHGGATTGPRYLTPAVGFGALALGLAWPRFGASERRGAAALLGVSVAINFACTAVDMTAGSLLERILPSFFAGDLRHTLTYLVIERPGPVHFVLPLAAGGVLAWLIAREAKRAEGAAADGARLAPATQT
jgi:hypothetical protein